VACRRFPANRSASRLHNSSLPRPRRPGHRWRVTNGDEHVRDLRPGSEDAGHLRSGPSGPYLDGFAAALERQGYSAATAVLSARASSSRPCHGEHGADLNHIDLAALGEHLRTCRCPCASGGRRNHHTVFGAGLFRRRSLPGGSRTVIPAYAHWRLADMPRYLSAEQVKRLIATCDGVSRTESLRRTTWAHQPPSVLLQSPPRPHNIEILDTAPPILERELRVKRQLASRLLP
jgi:hypothetical protein